MGIEYPVIQAGMAWLSNAELAAAISQAGGLGVVSPGAGMAKRGDLKVNFSEQIDRVKSLSSRPFGVGIFLGLPDVKSLLDIAVKEGVRVVITAGGSPALYTGYLKDSGVKVLHVVASVRHAKGAEATGVDGVIAEGFEGGGLRGREETPTLALVPQIVDAVGIPVVASGGISDGRGLASAMALGADGVVVGTRFIATPECVAHPRYKEAILSAIDGSTLVLGSGSYPIRVLKTAKTLKMKERESTYKPDFWQRLLTSDSIRAAAIDGDIENGIPLCSVSAGMVLEIRPAGEILRNMVKEAESVLGRLK